MNDAESESAVVEFGRRVSQRADALGLKQADIVRLTGIGRSHVSKMFAGRGMVGAEKLFALADALQCSPRWLATGEDTAMRPVSIAAVIQREVAAIDRRAELARMNAHLNDWVQLREFDTRRLRDDGDPTEIGVALIRREEASRFGIDPDRLWVTRMPSSALPELAREGETLICTDPEQPLVDGAAYIFRMRRSAIVRRFSLAHDGWTVREDGTVEVTIPVPSDGGDQQHRELQLEPIGRILSVIRYVPA